MLFYKTLYILWVCTSTYDTIKVLHYARITRPIYKFLMMLYYITDYLDKLKVSEYQLHAKALGVLLVEVLDLMISRILCQDQRLLEPLILGQ